MTDVVVEFKVPGDYVVQQSPQNLPPVYSGEKMVVYGVLTHKGSPKDQTITGKAILKGQILGKKMEHSVPFTFNPVVTSSPSLPTIHHLAAKSLIKDWQDQGKSKEEIVKLSIESSVISSHTAFIAVDEENSEPVAGAMKTWDITTPYYPRYPIGMARGGFRGGGGGGAKRFLVSRSSAAYSSPVARKKEKKKAVAKKKSAAPKKSASSSRSRQAVSDMDLSRVRSRSRSRSRSPSPVDKSSHGDLNSIITAQQANGSWSLNTALACMQDKSETEIKSTCPTECKDIVAAVWATVLILTLLRKKYSSQQDEWELIAMKAESWVKKQTLPSGVTIQDFYSAAEQLQTA